MKENMINITRISHCTWNFFCIQLSSFFEFVHVQVFITFVLVCEIVKNSWVKMFVDNLRFDTYLFSFSHCDKENVNWQTKRIKCAFCALIPIVFLFWNVNDLQWLFVILVSLLSENRLCNDEPEWTFYEKRTNKSKNKQFLLNASITMEHGNVHFHRKSIEMACWCATQHQQSFGSLCETQQKHIVLDSCTDQSTFVLNSQHYEHFI